MNHGLKLLTISFTVAGIAALLGCWYENTHPSNRRFTGELVHCEIHAHRDLADAIREEVRDREYRDMPKGERDYREYVDREKDRERDNEQKTDFGSMS